MGDYRNTKYCAELEGIIDRKAAVKKHILSVHPKAKDMHAYISKNDGPYKKEFMSAYNFKCAYCGISIDIINMTGFEIDHFINEASFATKAKAGYIENLILACHDCNNGKKGFGITKDNYNDLCPDRKEICTYFIRDDMYNICLTTCGKAKADVELFYKTLRLDNQIHRIDFLLMNMIGLLNKMKKAGQNVGELAHAVVLLNRKRHIM